MLISLIFCNITFISSPMEKECNYDIFTDVKVMTMRLFCSGNFAISDFVIGCCWSELCSPGLVMEDFFPVQSLGTFH